MRLFRGCYKCLAYVLFVFVFLAADGEAQTMMDIIYLRDGRVFRGEILERTEELLKVRTDDGQIIFLGHEHIAKTERAIALIQKEKKEKTAPAPLMNFGGGLALNLLGGVALTDIKGDDFYSNTKIHYGARVGLGITWTVLDRIAFRLSSNYAQNGASGSSVTYFRMYNYSTSVRTSFKTKIDYLQFVLTGIFNIVSGEYGGLYALSGPSVSTVIKCNTNGSNCKEDIRAMDFGVEAGIGVHIKKVVSVELLTYWSLRSFSTRSSVDAKNRAYILLVGLNVPFKTINNN